KTYALERFPVALEFSADGKWLAAAWTKISSSGLREGLVRLWNAQTLEEVRTIPVTSPGDLVHGMALSSDGKRLVAGALLSGEIRLWEAATGREIGTARHNDGGVW